MKDLNLPESNHGFAMINGRLIECDINQIKFHIEENMGTDCDAAFTYIVAHADWTEKVGPKDFYASVNAFKLGQPMKRDKMCYLHWYFDSVEFCYDGKIWSWVIDNGVVKCVPVTITDVTFFYDDKGHITAESPDIPTDGFKSEELAKNNLNVEVVNADGTTQKIVGTAVLIRLDDDQKAVVDDIVYLIGKAREMGVRFLGDWNGNYAFNTRNIDEFHMYYSADNYDGLESVDVLSKAFRVDTHVDMAGEENYLFLKRK